MIWFGSSAGVALASEYPEARSVGAWLKGGWHVALGYVAGFFVMLAVVGWHPGEKRVRGGAAAPVAAATEKRAPVAPAPAAKEAVEASPADAQDLLKKGY